MTDRHFIEACFTIRRCADLADRWANATTLTIDDSSFDPNVARVFAAELRKAIQGES